MTTLTSIRLTSIVFGLTYVALAIGKVPRLRTDRAGIALIGAVIMLALQLVSLDEAARAIDFETIVLLLGMMILVAFLQIGGFFQVVTDQIIRIRPGAYQMLAMTMTLSGILSAFLVNDVVCVALTPLILDLCRRTKQPVMPHLIGLATASNVGSSATITGNPQNIIIGSLSEISYGRFAARMAPIAVLGLVINFLIVAWVYRKSLNLAAQSSLNETEATDPPPVDWFLVKKGSIVTLCVIVLFFLGQPIATVALAAAAVMMFSSIRPEEVYRRVDWPLLMMFAGLFVIVQVFNTHVVKGWSIEQWTALTQSPVVAVSGLSIVVSNLVSNVPAVLLFKPVIAATSDPERAWLALAMSSTFAGNLTLLGSVANLIVVENARRAGFEVSFREYLKVGVPVTILTSLVGIMWLQWTSY